MRPPLPKEFRKFLPSLVKNHQRKVELSIKDPVDMMLVYSGALLNWVGEYLSDESIAWSKRQLKVDDLTLTGTGPEWNKVIIEQAGRDPRRLRKLFKDKRVRGMFQSATTSPVPILVRVEETEGGRKLKVLDGMKRTIAAIRDGDEEITAWVAERRGKPAPEIEPHVIYDFLRAYDQRGGNKEDLVSGLRFLLHAYANTRYLLETRFSSLWVMNTEIDKVVSDLLKEA
jgi:hypothetical protein